MPCPENYVIFGKNYDMSEKFLYVCEDNDMLTSPPPLANISRKNVLGALFFQKVPLENAPPPHFLMLPTPLRWHRPNRLKCMQMKICRTFVCAILSHDDLH